MLSDDSNPSPRLLVWITRPAPGLMFGSCILLGCCISSFAHRRQDKDRYQTVVLVLLAMWGATLGKAIGASANMITLGFIPWALCAAMPMSFLGHAAVRRVERRKKMEAGSVTYAPAASPTEK